MTDWPVDTTPVAEHVAVAATLRNDQPVAILEMTDITGAKRTVQLTVTASLDVLEGLAKFARQMASTNPRVCPRCGLPAGVVEHQLGKPSVYHHTGGRRCLSLDADLRVDT